MKEFEGALPSSFLLLELLLELLKKDRKKTNINIFSLLQITLFQGKTQVFCYIYLMVFQKKNTGHLRKATYSSRVNTILKVSLEYSPGYSTQETQQVFHSIMWHTSFNSQFSTLTWIFYFFFLLWNFKKQWRCITLTFSLQGIHCFQSAYCTDMEPWSQTNN